MESVRIVIPKERYARGEVVSFEIENRSAHAIHFLYGCVRPVVEKLEDGTTISLIVDKSESVPEPTTVVAEGTLGCRWDQKVWQDPSLPGNTRFQSYVELSPVPAGRYRLRLDHTLDPENAELNRGMRTVHSAVFRIE